MSKVSFYNSNNPPPYPVTGHIYKHFVTFTDGNSDYSAEIIDNNSTPYDKDSFLSLDYFHIFGIRTHNGTKYLTLNATGNYAYLSVRAINLSTGENRAIRIPVSKLYSDDITQLC